VSREINGHGAPVARELAAAARRAKENVWKGEREHTLLPAAGQVAPPGGVERTEFFSRLKPPMENGTGKAKGSKP
jgi:hypothetical protein